MPLTEHISHKLELLPDSPGCYIMKDENGEILYVGKAKVLKNRVRSYFHGVHDNKTTKLVSRIQDFEFIRTSTEKESLLLEINLIKKHRPPFNIMFMDDKMYPYIEVSKGPSFSVRITRGIKNKKNDYFGPYPVSTYAYDMVKLINRIYPVRKCNRMPSAPCLYYHMHQCLGYCFKDVDEKEGLELRNRVIRFLKGNASDVLDDLKERMSRASENLEFEKAQDYLNEIRSIEYVMERQTIDFSVKDNFDVFGWYEDKGYISFQGFFVREGKLLERNMSVSPIYEESQEAFTAYILQYYQKNSVPPVIYVPEETNVKILEETLKTKVRIAQRGEKKKLTDLVHRNAKEAHEQKFKLIYKKDRELDAANRHLSRIFHKPVHVVELFDNSHISGAYNVSGLAVFKDGKPDKSQYRHYQLQEYKGDTESMKEVVYRRYFRLMKEEKPMPDLLLVDGGMQQIHAAREVLDSLGLHLTLAGLVKDDKHNTRALLLEDGEEVPLDKEDPLFFLLTRMQDEVHRFAISYHRKLRSKGMTKSVLDDIPGIGPERRKQIRRRYPSLKKMRAASLEDYESFLPAASAQILFTRLHENESEEKQENPSVPHEEFTEVSQDRNLPENTGMDEEEQAWFDEEVPDPSLLEEADGLLQNEEGQLFDPVTGELIE